MDLAFWQRFLSAEFPPERCRDILKDLGNAGFSEANLIAYADRLSPKEKSAILCADMKALQQSRNADLCCLTGDQLPKSFGAIPQPPPALFVSGNPECLNQPMVGIVGTRGASLYGKAAASKFAEALALAGITVVSGGAAGIDTSAHTGAIDAGGQTVAVLGTGVDKVFPALNRDLFARIKQNGCLVSQYAMGTGALRYRFPARNHLIAMLSMAILVVEAPAKSGALITASAAADLGKQVFVVPSNITNSGFQGSHALIRDGATLVDHPDQILEALSFGKIAIRGREESLNPLQSIIMKALSVHPLSSEQLSAQTQIEPTELLSELTILELEGRIARESGLFVVMK